MIDKNKYELINTFKHSTDNPGFVMDRIKEAFPESGGFKIDFKVVPAEGEGLLSGRAKKGDSTVIADIYKEKTNKKTF